MRRAPVDAHRLFRCLLLAGLALLPRSASGQAAAPGRGLLAAAEAAPSTVVGRVDGVTRIDRTAYAATLAIERTLAGPPAAGASLRIAWEELGGRPPRLRDNQRVLLMLDARPDGSLWRQRFPDAAGVRTIAAQGNAFILDPPAGDVDLLAAYLARAPAARAAALPALVADGSPRLAAAALERCLALPDPGAALGDDGIVRLAGLAADAQRPRDQRVEMLALLGRARRAAAAPLIEPLAQPGAPLEAEALAALGAIAGGLPAARVEPLLDRPQAAVRAVAARHASGALAERRLPGLVRSDPDASVRIAAAAALADSRTVWGLDGALPALGDPDPAVRAATAEALGRLGAPAVPRLEVVARTQPAEARGAIAALTFAGPSGIEALRRLAADLPDEHLRDFARLALGRGPHAH